VSEMLLDSSLSSGEVRQIEQICDRFEAAWKAGDQPRLELYLGEVAEPLQTILLRQLLPLDWEYRLRLGDHPHASEYEERFPTVAGIVESIRQEIVASTAADSPPQWLGEYRIVRQLGRGGMGVVYEALHDPTGRRVALKVLLGIELANPIARARFRR
jgi:eukaryotic-like serine/threonine-protein kinase